nr:HmuY family protein [Pedobacter panaciterrae]
MNKITKLLTLLCFTTAFASCSKDDNPLVEVPVSDGTTLTLNGIAGAEAGSSAANSVYVDLSGAQQTAVLRNSWVLGFYSGNDFKVILNGSSGASAKKLDKTDLNAVTEADFNLSDLTIALGETGAKAEIEFKKFDDPREASILNKTAIETISATDSENKVYLVSPVGGSHSSIISAETVYKVRVLRKANGYTLQYAKLKETTFKSVDISKDANFNYSFFSLTDGKTVNVEPAKANWDLVWSWTMYYGTNEDGIFPYSFSDIVFTNSLSGIQVAQVSTSVVSYANFSESNLSALTFSSKRDAIGDKWRNTTGAAVGVKTDSFYIVKDGSGNIYKLKFNSFHASDGGVRGKPVVEYKLVKKG